MALAYARAIILWSEAMSEDRAKQGGDELVVVSLEQEWERRNWMRWLHCSESELRLAVETMGPDPDNVRRFLRQAG
jgi:hypothetical protein